MVSRMIIIILPFKPHYVLFSYSQFNYEWSVALFHSHFRSVPFLLHPAAIIIVSSPQP